MSGADEHIHSDSEVSHEEDSAVEDSETSPNHPSTSNGPKSGMTNGNRTPTKKPAPRTPTSDDRANSPMLRLLLSSPGPVNLPVVITSPLQASTSRAIFIPPGDAAETSNTDAGSASVSVPGIAPAPEASTSTASIVPGAGEISTIDAGSASVSVPGIAPAAGASTSTESIVPGTGEISSADVGSAPATITLPEDAGASVSAPEDVLRASASSASNNPEGGEISKTEENAAVEITLPVVGATGIVSEAEGGNIAEITHTPEAAAASNPGIPQLEGECIPEIRPAPEEGNVPGDIPSIEVASSNVLSSEVVRDNKPESMPIIKTGRHVPETGAESARSPDLETVPLKEVVTLDDSAASESMEAGVPEAVQNIDADVPETLQSTVAHAPSVTLPADVEKAPTDEHVLKMVMEASVVQDLVPEMAEKSDQLSEPTEAMEITEPEKCTTAQEESDKTSKECAQTHEHKPVAEKESQALELTEESNENSNTKTSEATAVQSGQVSELTVEASQSSELMPVSSEKYSQLRAALEAKTTLEPATIGPGSGQTSKPTEETREATKPTEVAIKVSKPTEGTREATKNTEVEIEVPKPTEVAIEVSKPTEGAIEVSKPSEEAREASKPQMSAATASEPSQVTEPDEEPMDTSEPSESGSTPESKLEPGKIDAKSAERSPVKTPAKGKQEDLKAETAKAQDSPSEYRRSTRIQALKTPSAQRTHSESPKPKKERRTVRSATLERVPSDEKLGVRTRSRRLGSASSNSEMEGSGDEVKAKRVSRKDSKK